MKVSRFLVVLAVFAMVVGFVSANDFGRVSETPEQLTVIDFTQSFVGPAPVCSVSTDLFPFPPNECEECLDACHPRHYSCILACLNGPCI